MSEIDICGWCLAKGNLKECVRTKCSIRTGSWYINQLHTQNEKMLNMLNRLCKVAQTIERQTGKHYDTFDIAENLIKEIEEAK